VAIDQCGNPAGGGGAAPVRKSKIHFPDLPTKAKLGAEIKSKCALS
jgi:hypothetical protein